MKKIVASVSLVALGASSINAVRGQDVDPKPAKPWNISATLRGFYDDNVATSYGGTPKTGSYGFQVMPGVGLVLDHGQTVVRANYAYSLKYYDTKAPTMPHNDAQQHYFDASLDHAFSERYKINVSDSFAVGQEPDTLRTGNAWNSVEYIPGNNIRNNGSITFNGELTPLLGFDVGYANGYSDYQNQGISATLDRIENYVHLDSLWHIQPQTSLVAGYQFAEINYTGDQVIGILSDTGTLLMSDSRDNRGHYLYAGVNQNFSPELAASLRAGGRYSDYYNDPSGNNNNQWSPYVQLSLSYNYAPESSVQVGFTYDQSATDIVGASGNDYAKNAESATFFGTLRHRIVPNLFGDVTGQIQNSTFNGGTVDGKSETYYLVGLNLQYRFSSFVSADAGYNFDHIDSQIGRSYYRNRVYLGLTASY